MNARRTPWWHAAIALVLGLGVGAGVAVLGESSGTTLIGTPWFVPVVLGAIGVVALVLALNVHKYAATDPKKRPKTFVNPAVAFNTLVLCKSMVLAGAALAGWYGGQIIPTLAHIEGSFYGQAVLECAVSAAVCLADMVIGVRGGVAVPAASHRRAGESQGERPAAARHSGRCHRQNRALTRFAQAVHAMFRVL